MSQPMNMSCQIEPQGEIDSASGEFWVNNPFEMLGGEHNFSAFEANKFLLNRRGGSFLDLSHESSVNIDSDSRSAIAADFDRDGNVDLLVGSVGGGPLRLFLNQIPSTNRRVRIDLRSSAGGRPAIGARVTAQIGTEQITRDLFPVNGFMGQSPAELILGVGTAKSIDGLTVRWPDGSESSYPDVPTDTTIKIVQGEPQLEVQPLD